MLKLNTSWVPRDQRKISEDAQDPECVTFVRKRQVLAVKIDLGQQERLLRKDLVDHVFEKEDSKSYSNLRTFMI